MKITLIGAGNVGAHLGKRFKKKKITVEQVYSRTLAPAKALGKKIGAAYTNDLSEITATADIYIVAVKDDVIGHVGEALAKNNGFKEKLVVHTSGAVASTVLRPYFDNYGVFYPLQTFSKNKKISFKNIPICVDAHKDASKELLLNLGRKISNQTQIITDDERAILHVAAVFVNNFSNHLFHIAATICEKEQLDFKLLQPLLQETVRKINNQAPIDMQTGPARRGDTATIQKHLKYLQQFPEYTDLYAVLTKSIRAMYQK